MSHDPYTVVVTDKKDVWELRECSYNPANGRHTLGATVATGTLDEIREVRDML